MPADPAGVKASGHEASRATGMKGPVLNESQTAAAGHGEGPMLVLAGPGSGKTAVITERTCRLVQAGILPGSILVVTFTRAAAAEMRGRIRNRLGRKAEGITIGTFHGVFFGMLRAEMGLAADSILSGDERRRLLGELILHSYRGAERETELPEQTGREISLLKNSTVRPEHFYSGVLPEETFRSVYRQYEAWMAENGRLDFDDIILRCRDMLRDNPQIRQRWQKKFHYIMVDEFQDIAPVQYDVIRMLAAPENNLLIVGDDDQSIYRFRGASPEMMLNFRNQYPNAKTAVLDVNYRCSPEILQKSQQLIAHNRRRYAKHLHAAKEHGRPVGMHLFENPGMEARWIADEIRKHMSEGVPPEKIAVLFRTNSGCRNVIEQLISDQIPFHAVDTVPFIFDHWIARDVMAYLELAAGSRKRGDFLRICNRPNRYLSRNAFRDSEISFSVLYDYYEDKDWMCDRLIRLEEDLRFISRLQPFGAIQYIQSQLGYEEYLKMYAAEHGRSFQELSEVLDELKESAKKCPDLQSWKKQIGQLREQVLRHRDDSGVAVSTLHASKGKEYRIVFIADVNEGIIPWRKAVLAADLEEERRMLYVGMTRAQEVLQICAVRKRYEKTVHVSEFLDGLFPA